MDEVTLKEVALYIENGDEALSVAQLNFDNNFYAAINRAYYAIFYAANALLVTQKLA